MNINVDFFESSFNWKAFDNPSGTLELSSDPSCSYRELIKILTAQDFEIVPQKYLKLTENFVSSSQIAPLLMPKKMLKSVLKDAECLLEESLASPENKSYFEVWYKIFCFLEKMQKAKVDKAALEEILASGISDNSHVLQTFTPDASGYAPVVKYSTCGSVTGRLKVLEGPRILTAPHEIRKCFRSSYEDGEILLVDFVSVEPRVAMITAGQKSPVDVYEDLLNEFPHLTRQAAKLVTLAALYGSSANKLSDVVGDISDARKSIEFVRSHFRVQNLERMLSEQADNDVVRNAFGRPLREATKNPRVRTNHFLQSSAAELCVISFSDLCEKFPEGVKPLFVIHDALVVDVHPKFRKQFCLEASSISWKENPMPVKIERLSPT